MAITTTLAACNVNPALNGPDGATDLPSTLDDQCRYLASFIAQLRDGVSSSGGVLWMTGMIARFASTTTPTGWLKLNGQLVSRSTYANLFAFATSAGLISEANFYGGTNQRGCFTVGDGSSTFRLPDLRGSFTRGLDEGLGLDPGRVIGAYQFHETASHNHGVNDPSHSHGASTTTAGGHSHAISDPGHSHAYGINNVNTAGVGSGAPRLGASVELTSVSGTGISINGNGDHTHGVIVNGAFTGLSIQNTGGTETRPLNVAWPYYIKY